MGIVRLTIVSCEDGVGNLSNCCSCVTNDALFGQPVAKGPATDCQCHLCSTNTKGELWETVAGPQIP